MMTFLVFFDIVLNPKTDFMKTFKTIICLLLLTLFCCSKDDNGNSQNIANRASSCETILGYKGLYWDFANGLPTGLSQVPVIQNPGQQFIHSQIPLLGFILPQGFTGFEVTDPQTQTLGVNVFRDDNAVLFRWVPTSTIFQQAIASQSVIANEINTLLNFYNFNGTPEVLCSEFSQEIFGTIPREFNARLLRFNGRIAQVWVITTYAAGNTYATISITTAPEAEYDAQVINSFLPLNFQLYVNDNGDIVDQDGDGWTVLEDPDDNNPNVP